MMHRLVVFALAALFSACSLDNGENPFPYKPTLPEEYNLSNPYPWDNELKGLSGKVRDLTHELFDGEKRELVGEWALTFDSLGHCKEYYVCDRQQAFFYNYTYDSLCRRVEEHCYINSSGGQSFDSLYSYTTYRYSRNGRICRLTFTSPEGRHYRYRLRLDGQGRITRYCYPDGSRMSFDYDSRGNITRVTYPDASYEIYEYDDEGRMTTKKPSDGPYVWYAPTAHDSTKFDSRGRLVEMVSGDVPTVTTYEYDDHDNWVYLSVVNLHRSSLALRNMTYYE